MRATFFWLIVFVLAATTAGALLPNAAGPRLGPISIIEVDVSVPGALDFLTSHNYDISAVHAATATVYATSGELQELTQNGIAYKVVGTEPRAAKALTGYHTYDSLTTELQNLAAAYPAICRLSSIGQSVQGRELWVCLITHEPDVEQDKPAVKYVSTIHGDEPVGTETCMDLINLLLANDGVDARITALLENSAVWILPLMNPDGLTLNQRYNANGYDLNRSFPAYPTDFTGTIFTDPVNTAGRQPEVADVMNWIASHTFVVSANFHTGSLVVNYPYDNGFDANGNVIPSGTYAPSPDDALFQDIAKRYSMYNLPMWNSTSFPDGITNGNAWYSVVGGMQDWNYRYATCNEVTIELDDIEKTPPASSLPGLWSDNEDSMLTYLESGQIGIRGVVTDRKTGQPVRAEITIQGNTQPVVSNPDVGNYQRMLLPGTYTLNASATMYIPQQKTNIAVAAGPASRVDIALASADINGDGNVDAEDVQLVVRAILGLPVSYDCDLDGDGEVTASDLQLLVNYVLANN